MLAPVVGYDGTPVYAMRKTSSGGSLEDIKDALYKISSDKYKDFEYYLLADANKSNIGLIDGQSVLTDYDQWDYYFRTYGEKLQEQADEKITVVIPGGFKPPHRGHVEMINHFANLPEVGEVIIFTGSKPRMSEDGTVIVTKDKTIELFKLFGLAPNVRFGEVRERPKKDGSTYENPFMDAVGILFDENFAGKKVAIGHPTKDATYSDQVFLKLLDHRKIKCLLILFKSNLLSATWKIFRQPICEMQLKMEDFEEHEKVLCPTILLKDYLNILVKK